jgi:thiol-disulfide isomerase/thioredoxin
MMVRLQDMRLHSVIEVAMRPNGLAQTFTNIDPAHSSDIRALLGIQDVRFEDVNDQEGSKPHPPPQPAYHIKIDGKPVPVKTAKPVTLEKLEADAAKKLRANGSGNVRLINFWSTTCGPCVAEFPDLVDAYRRFQNRSFDMITISLDPVKDEAKALKFLEKQHAALSDRTKPSMEKEGRKSNNYIFSGGNPDTLAEAIDPEWTGAQPHTVLLSPKGDIVWRHNGPLDIVEMRRQIVKALEGMP